jgi:hypothetical protein
MLGTGLVVVCLVIFGLWMAARQRPQAAAPAAPAPADARLAVRELTARFAAATSPEGFLPLIREPDKFEKPMRAWLDAHAGILPFGGEVLDIRYPRRAAGANIVDVSVTFTSLPATRLLAVETPDGYRVDWRAFTGIAELGIADFVAQKPAAPVLVMVMVTPSDYFNNSYARRENWLSLRATDRRGQNAFFAYVARSDASLMQAMAALQPKNSRTTGTRPGGDARPMALRVFFKSPESAAALQAEVSAAEGEGWYIP